MVKNLFKGCLTVPNLLSLIRIFLIPAFASRFPASAISLTEKSPAASIRSASSERYSIPLQIS